MVIFPTWQAALREAGLPAQRCTSYEITIRWYLAWLKRNRLAATADSALAFLTWAVEMKAPAGWLEERWKDALR